MESLNVDFFDHQPRTKNRPVSTCCDKVTVAILAQGTTSGQCDSQGLFATACSDRLTPACWPTHTGFFFSTTFENEKPYSVAAHHNSYRSHFGSRYHIWSMRLARPFCHQRQRRLCARSKSAFSQHRSHPDAAGPGVRGAMTVREPAGFVEKSDDEE